MGEWLNIQDAAAQWGISKSLLARLCRDGRIAGAQKIKGAWMIPEDAQYPADGRRKSDSVKPETASRTKKLLPLPIGISDYRKASIEYYYIDKTLMIRDFLDEVPMVSLFTRPRRFGKTLNMDMLRTFFEKPMRILPAISRIRKSGNAAKHTVIIRESILSYFFPSRM